MSAKLLVYFEIVKRVGKHTNSGVRLTESKINSQRQGKEKRNKRQATVSKIQHRKFKTEQHKPY